MPISLHVALIVIGGLAILIQYAALVLSILGLLRPNLHFMYICAGIWGGIVVSSYSPITNINPFKVHIINKPLLLLSVIMLFMYNLNVVDFLLVSPSMYI